MRLFVEIIILFFVYLIIYRRVIEPFLEGFRNKRKPYNRPLQPQGQALKNRSATLHPSEIENSGKQEIIDADFTEL